MLNQFFFTILNFIIELSTICLKNKVLPLFSRKFIKLYLNQESKDFCKNKFVTQNKKKKLHLFLLTKYYTSNLSSHILQCSQEKGKDSPVQIFFNHSNLLSNSTKKVPNNRIILNRKNFQS